MDQRMKNYDFTKMKCWNLFLRKTEFAPRLLFGKAEIKFCHMQPDWQSYRQEVWVSMPNCAPAWTEAALWVGNKSAVTTPQCCLKKMKFTNFWVCGCKISVNKTLRWRICTQKLLCSGSEKSECQSKRCPWQPSYMLGFKFNDNRNKRQRLHVLHRETSKWRKDACSPNFVTQAVFHQPRREKQTSCPKSWLRVHRVVASATEAPGSKQGGQICRLPPPPQGRERSSINGCQGVGMQSPLAEAGPVPFPFMPVATQKWVPAKETGKARTRECLSPFSQPPPLLCCFTCFTFLFPSPVCACSMKSRVWSAPK